MVLLVKFQHVDDSDSTIFADVMICSSKDCAKEIILDIINKDFNGKWKNLREAADELSEDLYECEYSEDKDDDYVFLWSDNGNGEKYNIVSINQKEVNTKFQNIGVI